MPTFTCRVCSSVFHRRGTKPRPYCSRACYGKAKVIPAADRFWNLVDKDGPLVRPGLGPCWVWLGACLPNGYGRFGMDGRRSSPRTMLAHRAAWVLTQGEIAESLCVLHRCDNPPCVRPDHLFLGDHADNAQDMVAKNRTNLWDRKARPTSVLRGEQANNAKLTEDAIRGIRTAYSAGATLTTLSREHGVGLSRIHAIVNRHSWKHVS